MAQDGAGLYGIGGTTYKGGMYSLVKYDEINGTNTELANLPDSHYAFSAPSLGLIDSIHNIYFWMTEIDNGHGIVSTYLYPYNLLNVSNTYKYLNLSEYCFSTAGGGGDQQNIVDPNTGYIYIWCKYNFNIKYQLLLKLFFNPDYNNATIEVIGNYTNIDNDIAVSAGGWKIYDTKRDMIYFLGLSGYPPQFIYYYINAKTGKIDNVIKNKNLTLVSAQYNPNLDKIVGITGDYQDGNYNEILQFVYVDPITLDIVKNVSYINNTNYCAEDQLSTQDIDNNIFYFMASSLPDKNDCNSLKNKSQPFLGNLVGVDINSGKVVSDPIGYCTSYGTTFDCPWDIKWWNGPN